jgi:HlyD family secretion protein
MSLVEERNRPVAERATPVERELEPGRREHSALDVDLDRAVPGEVRPKPKETPPPIKDHDQAPPRTAGDGASAPPWRTKRFLAIVVLVLVVAGAGGFAWWFTHRGIAATELRLHGNVDLRQVALPFNNSERIAAVLVQEGDRVRKGQLLARLDTSRLEPQVAQAAAQVAAQRAVVDRLHHGSRAEEIAQARANLESAKADALNARRQFERKNYLVARQVASQQNADAAKAAARVAEARVDVNQKALDLAILGPRQEDIDQAEAQLRANEAQLAYLRQQLADSELRAPLDSIIRSRLMEPGEMASPQRPVFSLAIIDPKWVRTYVAERDLGKVRNGMKAFVTVDSFPARQFEGWVGFVSPVAEFTPKAVETEELRTSLLYEVRVFVNDPGNDLPLGIPASVHLPLDTGDADRAATR